MLLIAEQVLLILTLVSVVAFLVLLRTQWRWLPALMPVPSLLFAAAVVAGYEQGKFALNETVVVVALAIIFNSVVGLVLLGFNRQIDRLTALHEPADPDKPIVLPLP
jgi:hypothetical protein